MTTPSTAAYVEGAAASEIDWTAAYQELLPRVFRYFCLRTGSAADAEDLTASTFERAWRSRGKYSSDLGGFSNWVFGIARHLAIAHFRRTRQSTATPDSALPDGSRPTEDAALRQAQFERLASALSHMAPREREVFSLKYGSQFTNRSIASLTGLTETNVGTILHRVVTTLRDELREET
jgi:RNA polymerase sigma-70 factor (ECF subfamily)